MKDRLEMGRVHDQHPQRNRDQGRARRPASRDQVPVLNRRDPAALGRSAAGPGRAIKSESNPSRIVIMIEPLRCPAVRRDPLSCSGLLSRRDPLSRRNSRAVTSCRAVTPCRAVIPCRGVTVTVAP
jgi:hypothetical protein